MVLFSVDLYGCSEEKPIDMLEMSGTDYTRGHIHEITAEQYNSNRLVLSSKFHVNGKSRLAAEYLNSYYGFTYMFRLFHEYMNVVVYKDINLVNRDWADLHTAGANEITCDSSPRREHYDLELEFPGLPSMRDVDRMFSDFYRIREAAKGYYDISDCLHNAAYVYNASRKGKLSLHVIYENVLPNYRTMNAWSNSIIEAVKTMPQEARDQARTNMIDHNIYKSGEALRIPGSFKLFHEGSTLQLYKYTRVEYDDDTEADVQFEIELERDTFKPEHDCMALISFVDGFPEVPQIFLNRLVYTEPSIRRAVMNRDGRSLNDPLTTRWGYALELTGKDLKRDLTGIDDAESATIYIRKLKMFATALLYLSDHGRDGACVYGDQCQTKCIDFDTYDNWSKLMGVCKCFWGDNQYGRAVAWAITMRTFRGQRDRLALEESGFNREWIRRAPCTYNMTMGYKTKGYAKKNKYKGGRLYKGRWCSELRQCYPDFEF